MSEIKLVIKRSKKAQEFDKNKILSSVIKVFNACKSEITNKELDRLYNKLDLVDGMRTEDIQKQIENTLMAEKYFNEARFYIIYRHINYYQKYLGGKVGFMKEYLRAQNAASGSQVDANANVTEKNLVTLSGELFKGDTIQLNRFRMYSKIAEMYDTKLADEYLELLGNHILYKNDESSILPYKQCG